MNKDIENLKNILVDLEDAENGAIINLSQEEINSLKSILNLLEKQQNQIERLKEDREILYGVIDELKEDGDHIPRID